MKDLWGWTVKGSKEGGGVEVKVTVRNYGVFYALSISLFLSDYAR